jgi:hypothetical protein
MAKHIKTMRGKKIDMHALAHRHGGAVALGSANLNARGDTVRKNGQVIKTKEARKAEYNKNNPKAVKNHGPISLKDLSGEVLTPAQAMKQYNETVQKNRRKSKETED